jgi:aldose sugar dehydrogenase
MKKKNILILTVVTVLIILSAVSFLLARSDKAQTSSFGKVPKDTSAPQVAETILVKGRKHIWDIAFLPSGELLFTERGGQISQLKDGAVLTVATVDDVKAIGEGGLMGLAIDPEFNQNRYIYACFNSTAKDTRVVRWRLNNGLVAENRTDIVTGIPANNGAQAGRHSGCRLAFGPDKNLWIGTGDAALGDTAIDPRKLGGKVLRVTRDGQPAAGNLGGEFDPRIYSYGHRNTQGLVFFDHEKNGVLGLSVEHGSNVDDEVNELRPGNFGWAPPAKSGYEEYNVPMTDKKRFPDAIDAIWSTGSPTLAPSGAAMIYGHNWKGWNGAIILAMLKSEHLRILRLDDKNKVTSQEKTLEHSYGRLRAVTAGPVGALYVGTSNGSDDKIIMLRSM